MQEPITYTTTDGQIHTLYPMGQGNAELADSEALAKDTRGFTNPNLHRRVETNPDIIEGEVSQRVYNLYMTGLYSYRTTKKTYHDEESTTSEIP